MQLANRDPAKRSCGGETEGQRKERAVALKKAGASDLQLANGAPAKAKLWRGNGGAAERARCGFEKSRSKRFAACSDVMAPSTGIEPVIQT